MNPPADPQDAENLAALNTFLGKVQAQILDPIITLLVIAAFLVFAYGVVQFILGAADEEKRTAGRKHMLWGIIGLTIMFGAQTILFILKRIVGVG